jgi:hypothetical protein
MTGLGTEDLWEQINLFVYSKQDEILIHSLENIGSATIRIVDMNGRVMLQKEDEIEAGSTKMVRGYSGLNIVTIETETFVKNFKVFIHK